MTFQAFRGSSGAQIAFTILLATSIGDCSRKGVANAVTVGKNLSFLENKVVINFDFRHGAKKSGHSDYTLSLNLAVKEQNERVYKCDDSCNFFCDSCKFAFSQLDIMPRGMT